ncbi:MAG: phosphatidate cytidylyltransferase [Roseovarius sp.]
MSEARAWHDLLPRVLSGVAMAAVGAVMIWLGGWPFTLLVCLVCGAMIWEAARMFDLPQPLADGALAGTALLLAVVLPGLATLPLLLASMLVSASRAISAKGLYAATHFAILLTCFGLVLWRDTAGFPGLLWLVAVVVASDVLGYFAGRMFGGPKFWPSISPKKTWSGTVAGWVGAALVGLAFMPVSGLGPVVVLISVLLAFAGQMGDIAESAIKRKRGVKDSSNLIPGHGGVLDRFDALMGASALTLLLLPFNFAA